MLPPRVAGGIAQSSSSSGISFQGDGNSQVAGNSQMSSKFGHSANTLPGQGLGNVCQERVLNGMACSGPSAGASSLVTDANSGLSGGPHLQRSSSINTDSYMRLPASPLSFSSNNISISNSSIMDASSVVQQNSYHDRGSQQVHPSQPLLGNSSATSMLHMGQAQLGSGRRVVPNSYAQEAITFSQLQKKPRLDIKQEDILPQQVLQHLSSRQDTMNLQSQSPQFQALVQQYRLRQQEQQILQAQFLQHQQQLLRLQGEPQPYPSAVKNPYDGGVCSRRLMQYLYHEKQRPAENSITYWRRFVSEYYSVRAKKRWCLSQYSAVGQHSLGAFPQASMDAWQCDVCGSRSGRGFEATFEVLPRLNEIKFASGVVDEFLFLDLPHERRFPSGIMVLEYLKAVQKSVYEQIQVVHEGHLRIIFTPELKIISWEFCVRSHQEFLPRRLIAPQVTQLLQVVEKCQNSISESGADNVPQQDLQANNAMFISACRQLARSIEPQSLNDLGFSKRYVRCLQIADVVNSMKGLMDFCKDQGKGPIEGLKSFPRRVPSGPSHELQEPNQTGAPQGLQPDPNQVRGHMNIHSGGLNSNISQHIGNRCGSIGSAQAAFALNNYHNMMMRQNSMNLTNNSAHLEACSPFGTNPGPSVASISGFPAAARQGQQPQFQQMPSSLLQQQNMSQSSSQALQQHMIQQMLFQEMSKKNNMPMMPNPTSNASFARVFQETGACKDQPSSGSNSCKATSSNSQSPAPIVEQKASDLSQDLHSLSEMISDDFGENGFFNSDLDDNMSFTWKG